MLTPELRTAIRQRAVKDKVSDAECIRRILRRDLEVEALEVIPLLRALQEKMDRLAAEVRAWRVAILFSSRPQPEYPDTSGKD